jgi:hypothetical protein
MTPASQQALAILRSTEHFQWYVIPLLAFVVFAYVSQIQRKNWDAVLMGLILSAAEFSWEMFNALILHFTGYSALWTTPGDTAYLILVGINIEIFFMFAVAGLVLVMALPQERGLRILGVPNRLLVPTVFAAFCALVETLLNRVGALVWAYKYWSWPHVWTVFLGYALPMLATAWLYDRLSVRAKARALVICLVVDVVLWVVFVDVLRWI